MSSSITVNCLKSGANYLKLSCLALNVLAIGYVIYNGGPWLEEYEPLLVNMITGKGFAPPVHCWDSNAYHFLFPPLYYLSLFSSSHLYVFYVIYFLGVISAIGIQLCLIEYLISRNASMQLVASLSFLTFLIISCAVYFHYSSFRLSGVYVLYGLLRLAFIKTGQSNKCEAGVAYTLIVIGSLLRVHVGMVTVFLFILLLLIRDRRVNVSVIQAASIILVLFIMVQVTRMKSNSYEAYLDRNYEYQLFDRQDYKLSPTISFTDKQSVRNFAFLGLINDTSKINPKFYDSIIQHHNWVEVLSDPEYLKVRLTKAVLSIRNNYTDTLIYIVPIFLLLLVGFNSKSNLIKQLLWLSFHLLCLLLISVFADMYERVFETLFIIYVVGLVFLFEKDLLKQKRRLQWALYPLLMLSTVFGVNKILELQKKEIHNYNQYKELANYIESNNQHRKFSIVAKLYPQIFSNKLFDTLPAMPLYKKCLVLNCFWYSYEPFVNEAFIKEYGLDINIFSNIINYLVKQSPSTVVANENDMMLYKLYLKVFYSKNFSYNLIKPINEELSIFGFELK